MPLFKISCWKSYDEKASQSLFLIYITKTCVLHVVRIFICMHFIIIYYSELNSTTNKTLYTSTTKKKYLYARILWIVCFGDLLSCWQIFRLNFISPLTYANLFKLLASVSFLQRKTARSKKVVDLQLFNNFFFNGIK